MPSLPALPGVTLLQANDVMVEGRLRQPVSVSLESGSRLVVTGPNGAGKSTLLAVLAGLRPPSRGRVSRSSRVRVGLLAQESPGADARCAEEIFAAQAVSLESLGLLSAADRARPVRELSMGQQRRLDLAVLLAARPHVVLLDEPTNHLSIALVDELTEALQATPAAVVVATHDRQLRRDVATWPTLALTG